MTAPDWQQIWAVFEEVVARPESERSVLVESACAGDAELARAVKRMLAAADEKGTILDRPVMAPWPIARLESRSRARRVDETARQSPAGEAGVREALFRGSATGGPSIGSYLVEREIGQGGMSTVYLARRAADGLRRRVVVKVVRHGMERPDVLERLRVERKILAGLEHPNIARLYDGGAMDDGLPFFVMEYVDGLPIDSFCTERELSVEQRVALFRQVCAAVHYAHQNLVIHRDLKPSNILVTADGQPKLLDFGIAKVLDPEAWALDLEPTVTANRMLTPSYASPEQFRGEPLSTASDVYSLGVLLYKLLTGRLPFEFTGLSPAEVERMMASTEPARPSAAVCASALSGDAGGSDATPAVDSPRLARQLEGDLDAILLKALRSEPPDRYGSAEQLGLELDRYTRGLPVEARQGNLRYRTRKFIRRNRASMAVATLIALLLAGGGVALTIQSTLVVRERDHARLERDQKAAVIGLFEDLVASAEPLARQGSDLTVRQLLTGSESILTDRLEDQPLVRAQLLHTTGAMLSRLDSLTAARGQLEEALALRRSVLGDGDPSVAATECQLSRVLQDVGDLEAAEALARKCVATLRTVPNLDPPRLAGALSGLATVLWARQNFDTTRTLALEARALIEESARLMVHESGTGLQMLAAMEIRQGRYQSAVALLREALAAIEKLYGKQAPQREGPLNDLALALRWIGDLEAAEAVYEESRKLVLATYGNEHSEYGRLLNNLAGLRFARADYAGAATAYEEAHAILLATAPDNWRVFFLETNIQAARIRQGQTAEAVRLLRAGRANWSRELGADHWLLARVDSLLGEAAAAEGRYPEAERLLAAGFRQLVEVGAKHRYQRQAFERLSAFLAARGRGGEIAAWEAMMPAAATPAPPG